MTAYWLDLAIAAGTVMAAISAWASYRISSRGASARESDDHVRSIAREEVTPVRELSQELSARIDRNGLHSERFERLLQSVSDRQGTLLDRMAVVETKIGVFWQAVAMDAAKILHQPDPERAHVDALLESFMEGTLSGDDRTDLRRLLVAIRNWEPGQSIGFPVHPGEQVTAAILLATMDLVSPGSLSVMGHAAHRSAAHAASSTGGPNAALRRRAFEAGDGG